MLDKKLDVLCITEPVKFSGMFNSAKLAANQVLQTHPTSSIEVLECRSAAAGQGLVAISAARQAASGRNLSQVLHGAKKVMDRLHLYAAIDTLHYLVKGGRVPKAAQIANSFLKIKPIFTVKDGDAHTVALPRTMEHATSEIFALIGRKLDPSEPLHLAVMHAANLDAAKKLKQRIVDKYDGVEVFITEFTPVMGVHTGPGLIGVAFYNGEL
jgi:DegV family protein with EDD domain